MRIRGISSRRWPVSLCGVLCVGLVLALSAAGAAGKLSCRKGAEAVGCTLPDGTRFHEGLGEGRSLTVGVGGKGVSVTLSGVPIRCTKPIGMQGKEAYVGLGLSAPQHPEVGKSYELMKTKSRSEGKGGSTSASTTEVTLNFKSAKQVLVSIHQVTTVDGKTGCEGGGSYRVKRQS
jgi:hypothetical protein